MPESHYRFSRKCLFNLAVAVMVLIDFLAFCLSFVIAHFLFPFEFAVSLYWVSVLGCTHFLLIKSYTKHFTFLQESVEIVKGTTTVFLIAFLLLLFGSVPVTKLIIFLTLAWLNALYLLPLARYGGRLFLVKFQFWQRTILIVGTGKKGQSIAKIMDQESVLGYEILGFLTHEGERLEEPVTLPSGKVIPVLGVLESAECIVNKQNIDIILAAPDLEPGNYGMLARRLQSAVSFFLVLDLPDITGYEEAGHFIRAPWLALPIGSRLVRNAAIKRFFDLIIGGIALLVSLPLFAIIFFILKIDLQGPVFFAHTRVGRYGKPFKCWKFRTMCLNAEEVLNQFLTENPILMSQWEENGKLKDDPRVTRIGKLLRKTSLDELPQILNVLKGDMSIVGPRPLSPRWLQRYGPHQEKRLQVRPGITGLWQVSGRNDIEYAERIYLDNWYICNWSIWLDIIILFKTLIIVLNRYGAY